MILIAIILLLSCFTTTQSLSLVGTRDKIKQAIKNVIESGPTIPDSETPTKTFPGIFQSISNYVRSWISETRFVLSVLVLLVPLLVLLMIILLFFTFLMLRKMTRIEAILLEMKIESHVRK